eukprot:1574153-Pyramimonas_sp.AAC.1
MYPRPSPARNEEVRGTMSFGGWKEPTGTSEHRPKRKKAHPGRTHSASRALPVMSDARLLFAISREAASEKGRPHSPRPRRRE